MSVQSDRDEALIQKYFETIGFEVIKADLENNQKNPDFKISCADLTFFVEVKSLTNQQELQRKQKIKESIAKRFKKSAAKLHRPLVYGYSITISNSLLEYREDDLIREADRYFNSCFDFKNGEVRGDVRSELFQLKRLKEFIKEPLIDFRYASLIRNSKRIRDLIKNASKKYKKIINNCPYVLVIVNHDFFLDSNAIQEAMFGDLTIQFSRKTEETILYHGDNASLQKNKHTRISAIAILDSVESDYGIITGCAFTVHHNPFAKYPLSDSVFAQPPNKQAQYTSDSINWIQY